MEDGSLTRATAGFFTFYISYCALPIRAEAHPHSPTSVAIVAQTTDSDSFITRQFSVLEQIADGWCKGIGVAPNKTKLKAVAKMLANHYPEHLRPPTITPTLEGDLLLEWGSDDKWVNLSLDKMDAEFCVLDDNGYGHSEHFDVGTDEGATRFARFLQGRVPTKADKASDILTPSLYTIAAERLADLQAGRSTTYSMEEVMREHGLAN